MINLQFEHRPDIFFNGQASEHGGILWEVRHTSTCALVDWHTADGDIVDFNATCIRRHQADNHVKTGCLACTVRAQQADDFAAVHRERHVLNDHATAVRLSQTGRA